MDATGLKAAGKGLHAVPPLLASAHGELPAQLPAVPLLPAGSGRSHAQPTGHGAAEGEAGGGT